MKKLISLILILAIALGTTAAMADIASAKATNPAADRKISIQPAGKNTVPANISPTTGRNLDQLFDGLVNPDGSIEPTPAGFGGMVQTGIYYPVMVMDAGYAGHVGIAAPFYGRYADVYYEAAKAQSGFSRMLMLFNDFHPTIAGASRSLRVGYLWIRQEWNAPLLYAGAQTTSVDGSKYNTNVPQVAAQLGARTGPSDAPWNEKVLFSALDGSKDYLKYKYRISSLNEACNVVWNVSGLVKDLLGERDFSDHDHTFKFGDLPAGGDDAEMVYVLFRDDVAYAPDENDNFYYNSMYEYDEETNEYYRYAISDMSDPTRNAIPFTEQTLTDPVVKALGIDGNDGNIITSATIGKGKEITFANVVIQYVDNKWPGGEYPYPILTGTGNADIFMGGKHFNAVWKRDTVEDRTVYYGEDGQEIPFQVGRTIFVQMDYQEAHRAVKYE